MALWKVERDGGIAVATYNNPPMNYFSGKGVDELSQLIETWKEPTVRAVVLCGGAGGGFITHHSVEELSGLASDRATLSTIGTSLTRGYHALLASLRDLPKVVIAAMNGNAMGGGFELSLACDLRIAQAGDFKFGLPEVLIGLVPGGSGTQRLSRLIGAGRAIEFILRGRVVSPDSALQVGLVHEVAADAVLRARQIAAQIAAHPGAGVGLAKRAVYLGSDTHLAAALEIESAAFLEAMLSGESRHAMQSFVDCPIEQRRNWIEGRSAEI